MGPRSRAADGGSAGKARRKDGGDDEDEGGDRDRDDDDPEDGDEGGEEADDEEAALDGVGQMTDDEYLDHIGNYKPGSIREIRLANFLSYQSVVIHPGPRLNVVAGPNGTGKSTILNAICLGLGGEPKVLGRAEDIRDFVMHGEDVAEIEIVLTPPPGEEEDRVRRVIDRRKGTERGRGRGSSTFYLNGESSSAKQIQALVRDKYAIAIENLCTFLPQDKVGGFSALTPQDLLLETEKVLSRDGTCIATHMDLMEEEGTIQSDASDVEALQNRLKKLKHENELLELAKQRLEERERALEQLGLLRKKEMWLQFEALRVRAVELKEQSAGLREQLKAGQKELEPLQVRAEAFESQVKQVEAKSKALQDKTKAALRDSERFHTKFQKHDEGIEEAVLELNAIDAKRAQREELVLQRQAKVDEYDAQLEPLPPREELEGERDAALANRREANREFTEARQRFRQLGTRHKELEERAAKAQGNVVKLSDVSARRKQAVFRKFNYLAKAQAWLDSNRDKFRRPVVGPIAAEINPQSAEVASYIEQHVPNNTLKAYCVETKEDKDLLYNEVRVRMNVPINIILMSKEPRKPRYYSTEKMRELQRYGIGGFLDEMFTAPEIVMQALSEASFVDRVLVGDRKAYENMGRIRDIVSQPETGGGNLRAFAVCCSAPDGRLYKFQGNRSRYANEISVRQDDVEPGRFLSPGSDPAALSAAEAEMAKVHEEIGKFRPQMKDAEADAREKEAACQESTAAFEVAKMRLDGMLKLEEKRQNALRKLKEAQDATSTDDAAEKKGLAEAIMTRLSHAISALEGRSQQASVIIRTTAEGLGVTANKTRLTTSLRLAELALTEKQQALDELRAEAHRAREEFLRAKGELQKKQEVASREAPIADDDGNDLPLREELDNLGIDTLAQVEVAIEEAEKTASSIDANPDVVRRYETRKKEIEELEASVDKMVQDKADKTNQLDRKRRKWESSLEADVAAMNSLFSHYMSEMGNVGELILYKGEPDEKGNHASFKDWGIKILVSFRGEAKAQVLSAQSHSGGERAVSTIMYLMAAQDMLVSPFRCVDEINQGLDERNERLVFSRIVANSCKRPGDDPMAHSGQYFLITPKLLPNLEDMQNPGITVLTVFNGPYNEIDDYPWERLLELSGKKRSVDDDGENSGNSSGPRVPKKSRRCGD